MNETGLGNLTLLARTAYAVMCFERYAAFVYPDADFKPAAELMWHLADGSEPLADAADRFLDMIPENLFVHQDYAAYQAAGRNRLTAEQFNSLSSILTPNDWSLNSIMRYIYQIATEYKDSAVKPGAPETLPYLEKIISMLKVRAIELPDLNQLQQYTFTQKEVLTVENLDWMGDPIDPAPLSRFGIKKPAECRTAGTESAENNIISKKECGFNFNMTVNSGSAGSEPALDLVKNNIKKLLSDFEEPVRPCLIANGCKWEIIDNPDGCIITRCINSTFRRNVTIPAELNGKPVIEIDDHAFSKDPEYGCMAIETLIMPDSIRQIGDCFFKGCTGLRHITMSANLESIGHQAFRGASRLESITIGDRCRVIGDYFCADGLSLRTVVIGNGIDYIGEYTFYNTPVMTDFRCEGMLSELGYGSFWVNRWADKTLSNPTTELLRFCRDGALLYRYVRRNPPPRLFFDAGIKYVYDFAFGGDAWHSGEGITDIFFPGAEKIGVQVFRKTPNATVHLSASRMEATYGPDYEYTLTKLCEPAKVVFDQP